MDPEIRIPSSHILFRHRCGGSPLGTREFRRLFAPTPRGARLARQFAAAQLDEWDFPHDGELSRTASLIVAELAGNAVSHGRVPGRSFALGLIAAPAHARGVLRIEVCDARTGMRPPSVAELPDAESESGRGLVLVAALAARWGVSERRPGPAPGKTVWAELDLP